MSNGPSRGEVPIFVDVSRHGNYAGGYCTLTQGFAWYQTSAKTPAALGWYNCSDGNSRTVFRYWDGEVWCDPINIVSGFLKEPEDWLDAKRSKLAKGTSTRLNWRNVKPYLPGGAWEFFRE